MHRFQSMVNFKVEIPFFTLLSRYNWRIYSSTGIKTSQKKINFDSGILWYGPKLSTSYVSNLRKWQIFKLEIWNTFSPEIAVSTHGGLPSLKPSEVLSTNTLQLSKGLPVALPLLAFVFFETTFFVMCWEWTLYFLLIIPITWSYWSKESKA